MYLSHDKPYVKPGDMDTAFLLGAGFEYQVKHRLSVRLDARWSNSDARPPEAILDDAGDPTGDTEEYSRSNNIEVLVSAAYAFGGPAKDTDGDGIPDATDKCPKSPEDKDGFQDDDGCKEIDNDGDQIVDTADRCPNTPEDKDGFRDSDGCPDIDNDEDGIPDAKDKCPNKAEDKDGFKDADGCPDYDNDGDGVTDKRDRCPKRKEDRDGFKDGDGCPDPDNDGDGFPDAKDKCPNKPENKNGFQDNDGCPDGMPAHIAPLFDGPLKGVKFRRSKLRKRSAKVLEKLLELLLEVQDVQIEIHVHTHTRGRAKRLKRISRKRGKAIVKFFVEAGIDKNRFVVIGHGGEEPVDTGKGRKAKKANERVILKLRPTK
ncbi:MAG TPA: hypothetical protein DCQ06_08950 [Myxococcales bacterium]|nr:hypothetical protein [Myxococcales bacterium]